MAAPKGEGIRIRIEKKTMTIKTSKPSKTNIRQINDNFQRIQMEKQQSGRSRMRALDLWKSREELSKIRSDFLLSFILIR
jgi:hypothetical protein